MPNGIRVNYDRGYYTFTFNDSIFATVSQEEVDRAKLEPYTDLDWAIMLLGSLMILKMRDCGNHFAVEQLIRYVLS